MLTEKQREELSQLIYSFRDENDALVRIELHKRIEHFVDHIAVMVTEEKLIMAANEIDSEILVGIGSGSIYNILRRLLFVATE